MSFMMLCGTSVGYAQKQKGNVPLVYDVENTGSQFAAPKIQKKMIQTKLKRQNALLIL